MFRIELKQVSKQFGEVNALWNLSAEAQEGQKIAIVGHNGSGKSTLLHILATLSRPSSGEIGYFDDQTQLKDKRAIRERLAMLSHESMLYPDLTLLENLRFCSRMLGRNDSEDMLLHQLERVGMRRYAGRLFRECSRGMQQRVSLIRALLAEPRILLLDEPFTGLDAEGIQRLSGILACLPSWIMVIHDFQLGFQLADHFWFMSRARLGKIQAKAGLAYEDYLRHCLEAAGGSAS